MPTTKPTFRYRTDIESLVNNACNQEDKDPNRGDRKELEKTTSLMFISSLILGERDDLEIEPLD
ncbi:hypothetical protein N9066_01005 [bacterium]|nr:hypothetical protein [bacterium]